VDVTPLHLGGLEAVRLLVLPVARGSWGPSPARWWTAMRCPATQTRVSSGGVRRRKVRAERRSWGGPDASYQRL